MKNLCYLLIAQGGSIRKNDGSFL